MYARKQVCSKHEKVCRSSRGDTLGSINLRNNWCSNLGNSRGNTLRRGSRGDTLGRSTVHCNAANNGTADSNGDSRGHTALPPCTASLQRTWLGGCLSGNNGAEVRRKEGVDQFVLLSLVQEWE